jgi:hypothetical protein
MPDGAGERILARIRPSDIARIQAAGLSDWLPFSLHQTLQDAKNAEVGEARAAEVTRMLVLVALGTPLLGGFVTHVLQMLGADPRPAFRWAPRGFGMILRGCGHLETTVHPTRRVATIRLVDMPPEVASSRSFVASVGHALSTIFAITGFEGTCTLAAWEPALGTATFDLTWSAPLDVR